MSEATSLPEKRKRTKNEDLESRESCRKLMSFFKLLEEMETNKISDKLGRNSCKGPIGSKIDYSYHIKINNAENGTEKPWKNVSLKSKHKKKLRN